MKPQLKRALLLIDVQNDYNGGALPIEYPPVEASLARIGEAIDGARRHGVALAVVDNPLPESAPVLAKGTFGGALHAVVAERGWDYFTSKSLPSALAGTGLEAWLRDQGIETVTVAGYMTHNCVLSTVLDLAHRGFAVELLADAAGSLPYANRAGSATAEEIHRVVTVVLQSRFAAVLNTAEWLEFLETGGEPERDSIYASNRRARGLPVVA